MDHLTQPKSSTDKQQRKVGSKLTSAALMPFAGLLSFYVLVETEGMGAKANLLEQGIPSGSRIKAKTNALRGFEYAINGVYEYINGENTGEFGSYEVDPWYMVVLPKRVHITTIFFLSSQKYGSPKGKEAFSAWVTNRTRNGEGRTLLAMRAWVRPADATLRQATTTATFGAAC